MKLEAFMLFSVVIVAAFMINNCIKSTTIAAERRHTGQSKLVLGGDAEQNQSTEPQLRFRSEFSPANQSFMMDGQSMVYSRELVMKSTQQQIYSNSSNYTSPCLVPSSRECLEHGTYGVYDAEDMVHLADDGTLSP